MKMNEFLKAILEFKNNKDYDVQIVLDGYYFDITTIESLLDHTIEIISNDRFPRYSYRFTYIMTSKKDGQYLGLTHRTYTATSVEEVLKNREDYYPEWTDIKYRMIRAEKVLTGDVYELIWEERPDYVLNKKKKSDSNTKEDNSLV